MSVRVVSVTLSAVLAAALYRWWERHRALPSLPVPSNPSLLWGHQKQEFEDNGGLQWRAWYKECGKAFKIRAAWGQPDIVSCFQSRSTILLQTHYFV